MSKNKLAIVKPQLPAVIKSGKDNNSFTVVQYEKIDSTYYSFSYQFDDMNFRMDESAQTADETDFVDVEYEEHVEEAEKVYYAVAAASGLLTGALSTIHLKKKHIDTIKELKEKQWKPIIVKVSNLAGYKKKDYNGAIHFLIDRAVRVADQNGKKKESLTVLAEHPSLAGLIFSLLTQYSNKQIILSSDGIISYQKLPDYYTVGHTNAEKIVCAVLYWMLSLAEDEAVSARRVLDDSGIPKELLREFKKFINLPFMKTIPSNYEQAERLFSQWLSRTIRGAELFSEQESEDKMDNIMFRLMRSALGIADDSFMVLMNECIVDAMYMVLRICTVASEQKLTTFAQFLDIPAVDIFPKEGKVLSRMNLIASASFAAINIAGATLKGIKNKKVGGRPFSQTFFTEINIVGVGRFIFACAADSKYWRDDIDIIFQRKEKNESSANEENTSDYNGDEAFDLLTLDAVQARILYCLENKVIQYDIQHTKKQESIDAKKKWLDAWKHMILIGNKIDPDMASDYFVEDEGLLYEGIYQLTNDKNNWGWFYLLTQELALFKPYSEMRISEDKIFKKLKQESDYVKDCFVRRQTVVNQEEVDALVKVYSKYKGSISGSTQGKIAGTVATATAAIATGGLALTFAPTIAATIAGEAVAGLHGAALTSASLAFVGGGSLAAGGLGMAGGTAIITGGGALLGLAGGGTISATTVLLQTPSEYWVRQSAKLLTYCKCVLNDKLNDKESIGIVLRQIERIIDKNELELDEIKAEKNDLDKEVIKKIEVYLKYLKKCRSEIEKMRNE